MVKIQHLKMERRMVVFGFSLPWHRSTFSMYQFGEVWSWFPGWRRRRRPDPGWTDRLWKRLLNQCNVNPACCDTIQTCWRYLFRKIAKSIDIAYRLIHVLDVLQGLAQLFKYTYLAKHRYSACDPLTKTWYNLRRFAFLCEFVGAL